MIATVTPRPSGRAERDGAVDRPERPVAGETRTGRRARTRRSRPGRARSVIAAPAVRPGAAGRPWRGVPCARAARRASRPRGRDRRDRRRAAAPIRSASRHSGSSPASPSLAASSSASIGGAEPSAVRASRRQCPSVASAASAVRSSPTASRSRWLVRATTVTAAANRRCQLDVGQVERLAVAPIEQLHDPGDPGVVDERDGQQRAGQVAGPFRRRPLEPRVGRDIGDRQRLPRRERVAGDPFVRGHAQPDDATALRTGGGTEHEPPGGGVMEGDRGGGDPEGGNGRVGDRVQGRLAAGRCQAIGCGQPRTDGEERIERPVARRGPGRVVAQRRAASASTARIGDDQLVAVEPEHALADEVGEQPVHRLPGPADHARQLALGVRPRQANLTGRRRPLGGLDLAQQMTRQPARQVEEMEVLELGGQSPDLARQRGQQRPPDRRVLVEQPIERVAMEHDRLARLDRDGRGRPRAAVEQGELAEEAPGSDGRQDRRLRAVLRGDQDLDRAAAHDRQRIAGVAGVEDHLAAAEPPGAQRAGHQRHPRFVETREQAARPQRLADERIDAGRGGHARIVRWPEACRAGVGRFPPLDSGHGCHVLDLRRGDPGPLPAVRRLRHATRDRSRRRPRSAASPRSSTRTSRARRRSASASIRRRSARS